MKKYINKRKRGSRRSKKVTKSVKRYVKKTINNNVETKYLITRLNDFVYTTQYFKNLTLVPQGLTDSDRVGDKLKMVSLKYKMNVQRRSGNQIRIIFFQWKTNTAVYNPSVSNPQDLILGPGVNGTQADICSFPIWDRKSEYTILKDISYQWDDISERDIHYFSGSLNLKKISRNLKFDSGSLNAMNHIYVMTVGNGASVPVMNHSSVFRLTYKDA